jgi:copper chaperone
MMARSRLALDQPQAIEGLQPGRIDLTMVGSLMMHRQHLSKEPIMNQTFQVQGMTCGHCVKAVTQALKAADPQAEVKIDLPSGKVEVTSDRDPQALARAIEEEGYRVAA